MKLESATDALRRAIRESGWSSYALAAAVGLSRPAVSEFVGGRSSLTLRAADKLFALLNLHVVAAGPLPPPPTIAADGRRLPPRPARSKKSGKASTSTGRATSSSKRSAREG
ncbi:MAG: hypothetical protein AMXMBFR47_13710 [Planctomycetota bacterium]